MVGEIINKHQQHTTTHWRVTYQTKQLHVLLQNGRPKIFTQITCHPTHTQIYSDSLHFHIASLGFYEWRGICWQNSRTEIIQGRLLLFCIYSFPWLQIGKWSSGYRVLGNIFSQLTLLQLSVEAFDGQLRLIKTSDEKVFVLSFMGYTFF